MTEEKPDTNIEQVIITQLINIREDLAVNTTKTNIILDHMKQINGTILEQQKSIQAIDKQSGINAELFTEKTKNATNLEKTVKEFTEEFGTRVAKLENWRWYILGITAALLFGLELYFRLK